MPAITQRASADESPREHRLKRALRLEWLTVGWNLVEGGVAVTAALMAGSIALLGFGIDSFVESTSAAIFLWRLLAERRARDATMALARVRGARPPQSLNARDYAGSFRRRTLAGLVLNQAFVWWWGDPVAARWDDHVPGQGAR